MSMLKLPIGYDNFGELVKRKIHFVDKTLFIKELIDDESTKILLITRPRRFGKTLNLSMLQYFFAETVYGEKTAELFAGLKIAEAGAEYMSHQGKYPVIFVSFKDIKNHDFEHAYAGLVELIRKIYTEHRVLLESNKLSVQEQGFYNAILDKTADEETIKNSLQNLCEYLYRYYGAKPWLLIDEYDTPIQSAYVNGYYEEMISIMRSMFGAALKTNPYLERAVLTGILRVAKESLFSGLNNLEVFTILREEYGQYFGFTEQEVKDLLIQSQLESKAAEVREWYNGYNIGGVVTVYNPWSIAHFINRKGTIMPYWVNTSDNKLIRDLIIKSSDRFKTKLEDLLAGKPVESTINEDMVFGDLSYKSEIAIWSLLLLSGYLKVLKKEMVDEELKVVLDIPNREVRSLYRNIIKGWLTDEQDDELYNEILSTLLAGDINKFIEHLALFMKQTASYHDLSNDPEAFFHGLLIGLTASLYKNKNYQITSNRESGYGRYDYLIFSHDLTKPTIIFELKRVEKPKPKTSEKQLDELLAKTAMEALEQIATKDYLTEAKRLGATKIIQIGLAFCGKKFMARYS
ncbi:MAG: AAA family ATPase [Gammaproteobacteria bacterium]|nr:AAA family ATPase [Gammaproteobacteria bacterium]